MTDGFWIVQFEGMQGGGGGVVFLSKGKVLGGDSGYVYIGTFEEEKNVLKGRVKVENFLPGVPNVLGVVGDFELELNVTIEPDVMKGTAALIHQQGLGIAVKLTKRSPLP